MGSILTENEVGKIFGAGPHEIEAPVTSGLSQGTKIFVSKIFSYHPLTMLFCAFCRFIWQKMMKIKKNMSILAIFYIYIQRMNGDLWRTRLGGRVFGVSKEASWPPGSNRMRGPVFPVHPDPEIRKNRIFRFSPFTGEPDYLGGC